MFGSEILDIALGLILIYLLLSLIASATTEVIEAFRKKRASELERGIRTLLADPTGTGLTKRFYDHPLISSLALSNYDPEKIKNGRYSKSSGLPSYIPSRNFALALMDLALPMDSVQMTDGTTGPKALHGLRETVVAIDNDHLAGALGSIVNAVGDDVDRVRSEIEAWYDSGMDRVAGWYKRYAQWVTLVVGLLVAIVVNADTVALSRSLAQDVEARNAVLGIVTNYVEPQRATDGAEDVSAGGQATGDGGMPANSQVDAKDTTGQLPQVLDDMLISDLSNLQEAGLPFGWDRGDPRTFPGPDVLGWILKVLGWLITALAISLGAPFWFDLLNKFMIVRSTVKPYEKSPPEPPVDRAARTGAREQLDNPL